MPEIAIVGAIHGDEPCGARAIERLVAADPDVTRPVKLIVANEEALDRGVRYVDEDLNRAFPGDPNADTHERRLAHALAREIRDCTTFSLHSTQSYADPFALVDTLDAAAREVIPALPVDVVVETVGFTEGRLIGHPHTIEAECGFQGTDKAATNAFDLSWAFLGAVGALSEDAWEPPERTEPVAIYRLAELLPKGPADQYEVLVENFQLVDKGETFASADDERLVAEEAFYPVLMSAYGYEDVFGFLAEHVGSLDYSSAGANSTSVRSRSR